MTHPELTLTVFPVGIQISEVGGRSYGVTTISPDSATRLVACWNACREMDDPVAEIAKLREGNQSLLQSLSELEGKLKWINDGDNHLLKRLESETSELASSLKEIDRLNNLVADRDRTIGQLRAEALVSVASPVSRCTGGLSIKVGEGVTISSADDVVHDQREDVSLSLTEHAVRLRSFLRAAYSLIISGDDSNKEALLERIESAMVNCSLILSSAK